MNELTGKERISRVLSKQSADRIPVFEHFWEDTIRLWTEQKHITAAENLAVHFGLDMQTSNFPLVFNCIADIDFNEEIIDETEETALIRDGNGALLRWKKIKWALQSIVIF